MMRIIIIRAYVCALLATSCTAFVVVPSRPISSKSKSLLYTTTSQGQPEKRNSWDTKAVVTAAASFWLASSALLWNPQNALAGDARIVGEIAGSGLVFKDTLQIQSFEDPKVKGVTLYVSNFQKPITERLNVGSFLSDPSDASVGCAKTGPVSIADNIVKGKSGEQVFDEKRSLFFKDLRVQRLYDEEKNTIVYVSFTTRFSKGDDTNRSRFKSSLCAVNLDEPSALPTAPLPPAAEPIPEPSL